LISSKPVFAVLGAGNGGYCTAADLTLRGYEVRLFETPAFAQNLDPVLQTGGIALRGVAGEGFAQPALVTTDIKAALVCADIVFVITTAQGHKTIAQVCAPHLSEGQIVVLVPGCVGGVLEFHHELVRQECTSRVILAETTSLMYAVKKENGNGVWARGIKDYLPLAAFPAIHTGEVIDKLLPIYPQITPARHVLDSSFNNLNHVVHPPGALMNLGFVENKDQDEWLLYSQGYTPGTGKIGGALDQERMAVAEAYGIHSISVIEALHKFYGHQGMSGENLHDLFKDSPIHRHAKGPNTTINRLLTEDVPYGLVPLASFGRHAGVPTPTMEAVITLSSVINDTDYWETGRSVESLGLGGFSKEEILRFVIHGPNGMGSNQ
jgi:opine dehydrogenase